MRGNSNAKSTDILDCQVGIDGSWQKRGYSSLNCVVTAVARDNKKVLDFHVMSKICRGCATWGKREGTHEYENWKASHSYSVNHVQSTGSMESAGALSIFSSSVEKHNYVTPVTLEMETLIRITMLQLQNLTART